MANLVELQANTRLPRQRLIRLAWLIAVLALGGFTSGTSAIPASASVAAVHVSIAEHQTSMPDDGWSLPTNDIDAWDGSASVHGASPSLVAGKFTYDYRPDLARPPPPPSAGYLYDAPTNTSDPAGDVSRVRRVSSGPEVQRVAPSRAVPNAPVSTRHSVSGVEMRDGFPVFDSAHDFRIPGSLVDASDFRQMSAATRDLRSVLDANPRLYRQFTAQQRLAVRTGSDRIPGYTWHHHQDMVRLQLVDRNLHRLTGHSGGRAGTGLPR